MIFCENCFLDFEIKKIINSKNQKGDCPCCGSKVVCLYDTEKDSKISELFQVFVSAFAVSNDEKSDVSLVDELVKNWNLFDTKKLESEKVKEILESLYDDDKLIDAKSVFIPKLEDQKFIKENAIIRRGAWKDFSEAIKYKNRFHTDLINTDKLKEYFTFLKGTYSKETVFYRARIADNEKGVSKAEMLSPPQGKASSGRANPEGISRLYLADSKDTAIHEIRASMYDYVTVAKLGLTRDIKVVSFRRINSISPFLFDDVQKVTAFALNKTYLYNIDEEMKRPLSNKDSSLLYIPMQYISDFVYSLFPEYDGIEYESTVNKGGVNIMLFDENSCECKDVETVRISNIDYEY